jgi:hypothetical protein
MKGWGLFMDDEINQNTNERMESVNNICFYILYSKYIKHFMFLVLVFSVFRRLRETESSQESGWIF